MKQTNEIAIVLCAGKLDYSELPIATQHSIAMIPVNGRPVIGWILNDLYRKNIRRVCVVSKSEEDQTERFLLRAFSPRMDLRVAKVSKTPTILHSLQAGLARIEKLTEQTVIRLLLGDTLITDSFSANEDFLYYGSVDYPKRWCLVSISAGGYITAFREKEPIFDRSLKATAGYYNFTNGLLLKACVKKSIEKGGTELSHALELYMSHRPILAKPVQQWYDFGHVDRLADARQRLLSTRNFNRVEVDPILGTITKSSTNHKKLQDELTWYESIPDELKVLSPRILSADVSRSPAKIVQEYYGYGNLAELFVFGELSPETWGEILQRLFKVHNLFRKYERPLLRHDLKTMYAIKTLQRLEELRSGSSYWQKTLSRNQLRVNGNMLKGIDPLLPLIVKKIERLPCPQSGCIIHGDFCFSNILYDLSHQIVRLVDPRGNFGSQTIYGDPRYDMAKLRHSSSGLYDFIVADMFNIQETSDGFDLDFFSAKQTEVSDIFDELLALHGYDVAEIAFLEGLLFLSMLPLHNDQPTRQSAMYCRALQLLNDVLIDSTSHPSGAA